MKAIVTFRFKRNPKHNPKNKQRGICELGTLCTDVTGEHHSCIIDGENEEVIIAKAKIKCNHITRIEVLSENEDGGVK